MRRRHARRELEVDPFYDMLFNMLIAFVFCFIVALLAMNPKALKAGDIPSKAEYLITVDWPDRNPNDIDTWVQDPAGNLVWFRQREAGLMYLDRDDRGDANASTLVDGRRIVSPFREEVVTVRGIVPGEFTVNVQYYQSRDGQPVEVTVTVTRVNPRAEIVFHGKVKLARPGDEATAARFTILADGSVANVNTLPKKLVQRL
ncbi:MAG: hypothetical protein ABIQ82_00500 [Variovorax sp.]